MPAYTSHPLCTCLWGTCQKHKVNRQKEPPETSWYPQTCSVLWLILSPLTNFESACGKSILPAVLIILRVENSVFVFFWSDVLLPLFLAVAVLTTQPAVIASLQKKTTHRVIAFTQMTNNRPFLNHRLFFITRKITRFYRNVDTVSSLGTNSFLLHRQIPTTKWFSTESNKYSC